MYKIIIIILGIVAFGGQSIHAQVGINTIEPEEDLDIDGTLRIRNTGTINSSKILGRDSKGTVGTIDVGDNVIITNNTINAVGASDYGIVEYTISSPDPGTQFHDMDLGLDVSNLYKVVIRFVGAESNFEISGIKKGTDGRHIILLNLSSVNMKMLDNNMGSSPINQITTLGSSSATAGTGAIELVYDGSLNRWLILNIRD